MIVLIGLSQITGISPNLRHVWCVCERERGRGGERERERERERGRECSSIFVSY